MTEDKTMETSKTAPAKLKISRSRYRLYRTPESIVPEPQQGITDPAAPATTAAVPADFFVDSPAMAYRLAKARRRVDYYSAVAGTVGVLPVPILDMLTVGGLQLKLIHDLSKIYQIPFSGQRAKAAVAALIGAAQTGLMVKSLFKYIPVYGYTLMAMSSAFAASTMTYAIGRVFIHHFELGGTLLDFDAAKLRGYFREQLHRKSSPPKE
jgi:uncharacterized protein (DUF697 family)